MNDTTLINEVYLKMINSKDKEEQLKCAEWLLANIKIAEECELG